jgi:hypothetical protein
MTPWNSVIKWSRNIATAKENLLAVCTRIRRMKRASKWTFNEREESKKNTLFCNVSKRGNDDLRTPTQAVLVGKANLVGFQSISTSSWNLQYEESKRVWRLDRRTLNRTAVMVHPCILLKPTKELEENYFPTPYTDPLFSWQLASLITHATSRQGM